MSRKKTNSLTALELDTMKTLWNNGNCMTISEIAESMQQRGIAISVASVAQVIKKLLEKKLIIVHDHKLVSNVYARTFETVMAKEEYLTEEIQRLQDIASDEKNESIATIIRILFQNIDKSNIQEIISNLYSKE